MDNLKIAAGKTTPGVSFESRKGELSIVGESYPENSVEFFKPLLDWLDEYLENNPKFTLTFKMIYFNTSSSKFIYNIIDTVDKYYRSGGNVKIVWYYEADDEDIQENGEELAEGLKVPFEIKEL